MKKSKPIIMLCDEIVKHFDLAITEYSNILNDITSINQGYLIKSTYVYIFSLFEVTLNSSLEYYLNCIPSKLKTNGGEFRVQKEEMIDNTMLNNLIESIVEEHVINASYKNFEEYIKIFCDTLNVDYLDDDIIEKIKEKKATRNLLLHNNLLVNRKYLKTAGKYKRADKEGGLLNINKDYLIDTINLLDNVLVSLRNMLSDKYSAYSKMKVLRDIWNYLFKSPMLNFDNYWVIQDGEIKAFDSEKAEKYIYNLSSYEKTMLAIWMQHFSSSINGRYFEFHDMRMWIGMEEEVAFFAEIVSKYPHIFQG